MPRTPLICSASVFALIAASPALGDVTADDVWSNLIAPVQAMGGQISATTTRTDAGLEIGETTMQFTLPLDAGAVTLVTSGMTLVENGNGTVGLIYPETYKMAGVLNDPDGLVGSVNIELETGEYITTASGVRGDITYEYIWNDGTFRVNQLIIPEMPEVTRDLTGTGTGMRGAYQITEGDVLRFAVAGDAGELAIDSRSTDDLDIVSVTNVTNSGGTNSVVMTIPTGKVDPTNLSQALRDGLSLTFKADGTRVESYDTSTIDGALFLTQNYGYLADDTSYQLDASGLVATGTQSDFWFEFESPDLLPFPIKAEADVLSGKAVVPLNQADAPVDVVLDTTITRLTLNDALWDMFDPQQQVPRDPANLTLDLSGKVSVMSDLLDFDTWTSPDAALPVMLEALKMSAFELEMMGATVSGDAAFTLDNSDLETFDGMPALDGSLNLDITGANGLMDTLVGMGLLPEEQAMGARMMLGMLAVPGVGDDSLTSRIEVKPDGQITANGQRLR
ncbi:MAG: hypothetical protein AB8B82_10715 [Roseovarius sp.]